LFENFWHSGHIHQPNTAKASIQSLFFYCGRRRRATWWPNGETLEGSTRAVIRRQRIERTTSKMAINQQLLKLNAREKNVHAGKKLEDFETHFRIKWC
jgi:hypothetical protein